MMNPHMQLDVSASLPLWFERCVFKRRSLRGVLALSNTVTLMPERSPLVLTALLEPMVQVVSPLLLAADPSDCANIERRSDHFNSLQGAIARLSTFFP